MALENGFMENSKSLNLMEKHRIESFKDWPFDDKTSCSVLKMAEAGFYWCGNEREKDTVSCFVCSKTLDGWEETDDPWKEHGKHAPQCVFIKYGRKESDLLVEEFLNILGVVLRNKVQKDVNHRQQNLSKLAAAEMGKFLG